MKVICPNQLSSQSLGSLDGDYSEQGYRKYLTLTNNDIICVHRYIDPGAQYSIARGAINESLEQAVNYISKSVSIRPLFVNETGAVKARHTGESPLYFLDKSGTMLHDMLFAPFFSGAAGPGSIWNHWVYMDKLKLWYHYTRFKHAIHGINPIEEYFKPSSLIKFNIRCHILSGKKTTLIWCRDTESNYKIEIEQGVRPKLKKGIKLALSDVSQKIKFTHAKAYNPWTDKWMTLNIKGNTVVIPTFTRSMVIKLY
jgi:hypothetical protein